jgi:hypothetical protein
LKQFQPPNIKFEFESDLFDEISVWGFESSEIQNSDPISKLLLFQQLFVAFFYVV